MPSIASKKRRRTPRGSGTCGPLARRGKVDSTLSDCMFDCTDVSIYAYIFVNVCVKVSLTFLIVTSIDDLPLPSIVRMCLQRGWSHGVVRITVHADQPRGAIQQR